MERQMDGSGQNVCPHEGRADRAEAILGQGLLLPMGRWMDSLCVRQAYAGERGTEAGAALRWFLRLRLDDSQHYQQRICKKN